MAQPRVLGARPALIANEGPVLAAPHPIDVVVDSRHDDGGPHEMAPVLPTKGLYRDPPLCGLRSSVAHAQLHS